MDSPAVCDTCGHQVHFHGTALRGGCDGDQGRCDCPTFIRVRDEEGWVLEVIVHDEPDPEDRDA